MEHQIFNKIECHPSTVSAIEHLLIASTQLGIDNLEVDFTDKLESNH